SGQPVLSAPPTMAPNGTAAPAATTAAATAPAATVAPTGNTAPTANPGTGVTAASTAEPTSEPEAPAESGQPGDLPPGPRATVAAKLGPAYAAADQVASFEEGQALAPNVLQAFAALAPEEIAVLPAQMQFYLPTVSCNALRDRPLAAIIQPDQEIVACSGDGQKY